VLQQSFDTPDDHLATFVEVILPLPLDKLYTYRVTRDLEPFVTAGKRVIVQFGAKKLYSALIYQVTHTPPAGYEAKNIVSVLDENPVVSATQFKFWKWMSSYYMCSMGEVMNAALPASLKLESETLVTLNEDAELNNIELTDKEYLITEALTLTPFLSIGEIATITEQKNVFQLLKGLYTKGVIRYTENIKEQYTPKTITCIKVSDALNNDASLQNVFEQLEKKPKQLEVLMGLIHLMHQPHQQHITKKQLLSFSNFSESSLKSLLKNGILEEYKIQIDRLNYAVSEKETFLLNDNQAQALAQIKAEFATKDVVLLHGITSSGKTHVYVKLIEEQLAQGKQVMFLLPEIALTSQVVQRIQKYFGDQAISYHSKFNANERYEIWQKVLQGNPLVVIGARSAIFLPFVKLGLVIVDEEHENSYKQQDPAPRYHARDAAIFLAIDNKVKTLLGSATPAFETYYLAKNNRYGLVELKTRFGEIEVPEILVGNIAEDTRTKSMHGYFTKVLYQAVHDTLAANKQVILFQNRRGYAPVLECDNCHWVTRCVNCDINLTYHKYNDTLKCHYCGYAQKMPNNCLACGSHKIELKGFGTEKIEDEVKVLFPQARVLRMDLDAAKSKHGHEQIIHAFENHEADILIGTQMLSKGLDFGNVALVGIINADQLLYFPDFRAHERAYQLLTQVGGRAGRKHQKGKVIIQTATPQHHVIQEVIHQRYEYLFVNEDAQRQKFGYPPYTRLIKLTIKHKEYQAVHEAALSLQQKLYKRLAEKVIGPESPYVSKARNYYIKEILVKVDRNSPYLSGIKKFIKEQINEILTDKQFRSCIVQIDVDTYT